MRDTNAANPVLVIPAQRDSENCVREGHDATRLSVVSVIFGHHPKLSCLKSMTDEIQ